MEPQLEGSWWFKVWQPPAAERAPSSDARPDWVLRPGEAWHGFEGLADDHVMVDPIKVTILSPGLTRRRHDGRSMGFPRRRWSRSSCRRAGSRSRRPASIRSSSSSRWAITKGKWSTLVTELINFKDLYDANAPLTRALPALAAAHPEAYGEHRPQGPLRPHPPSLSRRRCAEGAARDVHRLARDGAAAGRCLRPAGQRPGRKRRDRRPHGPNARRDGRALSAGHSR